MRITRHVLFLFGLFVLVAPRVGAQNEPVKGLDDYIIQALKDWNAPGLALAIVKDDRGAKWCATTGRLTACGPASP